MTDTVRSYWRSFLDASPEIAAETPYQIWNFGNTKEMAAELADLVLAGKKVATASLAAVNDIKPDEAPIPEGLSVVTDIDKNPLCVIQTTEIRHIPFDEVDAQFASDEGEGDQTLEHWRDIHHRYFTREAAELGLDFNEKSIICCERFRLLYPR
jgi:uncharacterized protein YhfF